MSFVTALVVLGGVGVVLVAVGGLLMLRGAKAFRDASRLEALRLLLDRAE